MADEITAGVSKPGAEIGAIPEPGASVGNWRDTISEEIRNDPSLSKFSEVGTLAKSYINLQKLVGMEKIAKPGFDFDPSSENRSAWDQVFNQIGRPETEKGYDLGDYQVPEGMDVDPQFQDEFKKIGHSLGFSNAQMKGLNDWYWNKQNDGYNTKTVNETNSRTADIDGLKSEWGGNYDENVNLARRAVNEFCSPEMKGLLDQSGMGDSSEFIKFFADMGKKIVGDTRLIGTGGEDRLMSQQDLEGKINELQTIRHRKGSNPEDVLVASQKLTKLFAEKGRLKDLGKWS